MGAGPVLSVKPYGGSVAALVASYSAHSGAAVASQQAAASGPTPAEEAVELPEKQESQDQLRDSTELVNQLAAVLKGLEADVDSLRRENRSLRKTATQGPVSENGSTKGPLELGLSNSRRGVELNAPQPLPGSVEGQVSPALSSSSAVGPSLSRPRSATSLSLAQPGGPFPLRPPSPAARAWERGSTPRQQPGAATGGTQAAAGAVMGSSVSADGHIQGPTADWRPPTSSPSSSERPIGPAVSPPLASRADDERLATASVPSSVLDRVVQYLSASGSAAPLPIPVGAPSSGTAAPIAGAGGATALPARGAWPAQASASGSSANRALSPLQAGELQYPWNVDQTLWLGVDGDEAHFLGKARLLARDTIISVTSAVDGLNRGTLKCADDFCVVYSSNNQGYYLLYRAGLEDQAHALVARAEEQQLQQQQQLQQPPPQVQPPQQQPTREQPQLPPQWELQPSQQQQLQQLQQLQHSQQYADVPSQREASKLEQQQQSRPSAAPSLGPRVEPAEGLGPPVHPPPTSNTADTTRGLSGGHTLEPLPSVPAGRSQQGGLGGSRGGLPALSGGASLARTLGGMPGGVEPIAEEDGSTTERLPSLEELVRRGDVAKAEELLSQAFSAGLQPTEAALSAVLQALTDSGPRGAVRAEEWLWRGIDVGVVPSETCFSALIFAHCQHGEVERAEDVLVQMLNARLRPLKEVFDSVIRLFSERRDALKVEEWLLNAGQSGWTPEQAAFESVIMLYAAIDPTKAEEWVSRAQQTEYRLPDSCFDAVVRAFTRTGNAAKASESLARMLADERVPSDASLQGAVAALIAADDVSHAEDWLAQLTGRSSDIRDLRVALFASALRTGDLACADRQLAMLGDKDPERTQRVVLAHVDRGDVVRAKAALERYRALGGEPTPEINLVMLSTCVKAGDTEGVEAMARLMASSGQLSKSQAPMLRHALGDEQTAALLIELGVEQAPRERVGPYGSRHYGNSAATSQQELPSVGSPPQLVGSMHQPAMQKLPSSFSPTPGGGGGGPMASPMAGARMGAGGTSTRAVQQQRAGGLVRGSPRPGGRRPVR